MRANYLSSATGNHQNTILQLFDHCKKPPHVQQRTNDWEEGPRNGFSVLFPSSLFSDDRLLYESTNPLVHSTRTVRQHKPAIWPLFPSDHSALEWGPICKYVFHFPQQSIASANDHSAVGMNRGWETTRGRLVCCCPLVAATDLTLCHNYWQMSQQQHPRHQCSGRCPPVQTGAQC